ncbi:hypothetical protein SESBI_36379 [Sesbania bispinosa]|nr:hypothetical protein SESBI_36379 [Sesbania bispinosa]
MAEEESIPKATYNRKEDESHNPNSPYYLHPGNMLQESNIAASISDNKSSFGGRSGSSFGRGRGRSNQKNFTNQPQKICIFCGKERHTVETCYFKHGFPPNFKFKNKTQGSTVNSSISSSSVNNGIQKSSDKDHSEVNSSITPDQYNQLMEILKRSNMDGQAHTIGHLQQHPGLQQPGDDWSC